MDLNLKSAKKNNNNKELHGRMMQLSGRIKGGKKETLNAKHNTFLWVFWSSWSNVGNYINNLLLDLHFDIYWQEQRKRVTFQINHLNYVHFRQKRKTWTFFSLQPGTAQRRRTKISTEGSSTCSASTCSLNELIAAYDSREILSTFKPTRNEQRWKEIHWKVYYIRSARLD